MTMMDSDQTDGPIPLAQVLAEEATELHDVHLSFPDHLSPDEHLKHVFSSIHRLNPTRSALCLSGGGIRSATFGLGDAKFEIDPSRMELALVSFNVGLRACICWKYMGPPARVFVIELLNSELSRMMLPGLT